MADGFQRQESEDAAGLRALLHRLTTFKVLTWGQSSSEPVLGVDREAVDMDEAHVVSSLHKQPDTYENRHAVVLDIDHPTWLVRSTTPGHYHLYIDVPGGIDDTEYSNLLSALVSAGVIEPGYAGASMARGHTDVRLPWIKKVSA